MAETYKNIITIEPGKRNGKPCIRGMRITVYDILVIWQQECQKTKYWKTFPN
jgi:uncharacterized protein (DUF433 family)